MRPSIQHVSKSAGSVLLIAAVLAIVPGCTTQSPGGNGGGAAASPPADDFTVSGKSYSISLQNVPGAPGVFDLQAGGASVRSGVSVDLFEEIPVDSPALCTMSLSPQNAWATETGSTPDGSITVAVYVGSYASMNPCEDGEYVGSFVLSYDAGSLSVDVSELSLSGTALADATFGWFTLCLEASADCDVTLEITELGILFGPPSSGSDDDIIPPDTEPPDPTEPTTVTVVDPLVVVEPAPAGEGYVTVSCKIQPGPDDVATVEADLSGLGGDGWETLEFVQEDDSGAEYLWQGYVVLWDNPAVVAALRVTDAGGTLTNVPDVPVEYSTASEDDRPTVVLSAEQVAGPGGKLVYHGREFTGDVEVPADTLVAAVTENEEAYFYHPALGDVALSEETSRKALFYWAQEFETDIAASSVKTTLRLSRTVEVGEKIQVGASGISIFITMTDSLGNIEFTAYNPTKRWVAIKTSDSSSPRFVPARNNRTETNLIRYIMSQGYPSLKDPATGVPGPIYSMVTSRHKIKAKVGTEIEVFGAWWRTLGTIPQSKIDAALQKDESLCLRLNVIDMAYVVLEGLRITMGIAMVYECGDLIIDAIFNTSQTVILGLLSADMPTFLEFLGKMVTDTTQNLVLCAINLAAHATPGTLAVASVVGTLLDVSNFIAYVQEDIGEGARDIRTYDAYTSLKLDEEDEPEPTGGDPCKIYNTDSPGLVGTGSWNIYYHDSPMCGDEPNYHNIWTFYEGGAIEDHWTGTTLDYTWQVVGSRITISETPSYDGAITVFMESDVSDDCWMMDCGSMDQLGASWEIPTTYWRAERRY